jgi:hypothetical protein
VPEAGIQRPKGKGRKEGRKMRESASKFHFSRQFNDAPKKHAINKRVMLIESEKKEKITFCSKCPPCKKRRDLVVLVDGRAVSGTACHAGGPCSIPDPGQTYD